MMKKNREATRVFSVAILAAISWTAACAGSNDAADDTSDPATSAYLRGWRWVRPGHGGSTGTTGKGGSTGTGGSATGGSSATGTGGSTATGTGGKTATGTGGSTSTGTGGSTATGTGGSSATGTGGSSATGTGGSGTGGSAIGTGGTGGSAVVAGAPNVLYTDLVAGPTTGGENNKGVYLSIFGVNFGTTGLGSTVKVFVNNVEVDNYRYLGASKGRPDVQQITVQVGALGNPTAGTALPIKVTVNGVASNTNNTFTVQPGDILFVSQSGNDSTGVKNDIAHPWRHVQTSSSGGAISMMSAGDVLVLRGGATWSDIGYDSRWFRFNTVNGSQPTGAKGHGYINIIAYPGEDVHYVPPASTHGGIHGISENDGTHSTWVAISGLHIESVASSATDGAPINLQAGSNHWRVVNNELGPWPAADSAADHAAGLVGNGVTVAALGNHIHDIGGGTENHGVYLDSNANGVELGYNWIHNVTSGNLIQTFDNLGGMPLENITVHHNLLYAGGRYGLNISEGSHTYRAWNNVIYNTALAAVRFSVMSDSATNIAVVSNTIYNGGLSATSPVTDDYSLTTGTAIFKHNVVVGDSGSNATLYWDDTGTASALKFERNLWFGKGAPPSVDSNPVGGKATTTDPKFVSVSGHDFSLQAGSPAIDQATASVPFTVTDDYRAHPRPDGAQPDVGAYEY